MELVAVRWRIAQPDQQLGCGLALGQHAVSGLQTSDHVLSLIGSALQSMIQLCVEGGRWGGLALGCLTLALRAPIQAQSSSTFTRVKQG